MDNFDVIVVGAGLAGCAAAYKLAEAGLQVLVIERGKFAGAKNVSGCIMYSRVLNDLIPNFWEEAPVERRITNFALAFLSEKASVAVNFQNPLFNTPPYNAFSVHRSKFDQWFAKKVEEVGATVVTNIRVDDLLWKGDSIVGIKAGSDEAEASVVIAADGAKSFIAEKARLRRAFAPKHISLAVKEVVELPPETINDRFGLPSNEEGAACTLIGNTKGIRGGGFLYTNKDSISLGVVAQIQGLVSRSVKIHELIEEYRTHPYIANLIRGGKVTEYSGDIIHEGGFDMIPKLYANGFLVVGNAGSLILNSGLTLRGADFAIASGVAAAEAVIKAKERNSFKEENLSQYERFLEQNFILKDIKTFRKLPRTLENDRIYSLYPDLLCEVFERVFRVDPNPSKKLSEKVREAIRGKVSALDLLRDGIGIVRSL